jgi:Zn finger protein HypA/HybF involved in hydrogenase expression
MAQAARDAGVTIVIGDTKVVSHGACKTAAGRRIVKVIVEIGIESCVSREALVFSIGLVAEGTAAENAYLIFAPLRESLEFKEHGNRGSCVMCEICGCGKIGFLERRQMPLNLIRVDTPC